MPIAAMPAAPADAHIFQPILANSRRWRAPASTTRRQSPRRPSTPDRRVAVLFRPPRGRTVPAKSGSRRQPRPADRPPRATDRPTRKPLGARIRRARGDPRLNRRAGGRRRRRTPSATSRRSLTTTRVAVPRVTCLDRGNQSGQIPGPSRSRLANLNQIDRRMDGGACLAPRRARRARFQRGGPPSGGADR